MAQIQKKGFEIYLFWCKFINGFYDEDDTHQRLVSTHGDRHHTCFKYLGSSSAHIQSIFCVIWNAPLPMNGD